MMASAAVEGLEPEEAAAAAEEAARPAGEAAGAEPGPPPLLAGSRLNLDLYPKGCHWLLHLCARQPPQPLLQVEFLRLSTHEDPQLLQATLAQVPWSQLHLRSLVLKGEFLGRLPGPYFSSVL